MGYDLALMANANGYFNNIQASYGILGALDGTSNELYKLNMDNLAMQMYCDGLYYRNLNEIQSRTLNAFSCMNNITNSLANNINTINPFAPGGASNNNVTDSNGKTGTSDEKNEYNEKCKFLEGLLEFKNIKEVKKALDEIKKGKMSYEEANKKLDEVIANLYANHKDYIEKYANKIAKDKYKSRKDGNAKQIADSMSNLLEKIDGKTTSADLELMSQITDEEALDKGNILQFISAYNKANKGTIIQNIQAKADGVTEYDGKRLWCRESLRKQMGNDVDKVIRNICNALLEKAEQYEDDLSKDSKNKVKALQDALKSSENLYKDSSLSKKFNDVYVALRLAETKEDNDSVSEEIDKYLPDDAKITVSGAKDKLAEDLENEGLNVKI